MQTVHRITWDDAYVTEAQRVVIASNLFFRLIYQAWWTWWLPRALIVGLVGWLVLAGAKFDMSFYVFVGAFLSVTFVGEYWAHRNLARARARVRHKGSTTTVTLSDGGIDIVGAFGNSHLKWEALRPAVARHAGILIPFSSLSGLWLPDSALVEGSSDDVRQLLVVNKVLVR